MAASVRAVRAGEVATVTIPDPDAVPEYALTTVIVQLAALQSRAAARLATIATTRMRPPDRLLDAEEAAKRLCTTPDWLNRQKALPFRVELSGGQVRWSEQGLDDWITGRRGSV
jgi:predicted DNA-binding transcriptional regulator AlpA